MGFKPNNGVRLYDISQMPDPTFNSEHFIEAVFNEEYILVVGSEVVMDKSEEPSQLNAFAYEQTRLENWGVAFAAIDKAIELAPKEANYYDSKGEILLMRNNPGDEKDAVEMWKKIMIIDPDFLIKYNGTTPFYEELRRRRLVNN